jgi:hypothetical protein
MNEVTIGTNHTFWRDPEYGALQLMGQYSYVWRRPWSVSPRLPGEARNKQGLLESTLPAAWVGADYKVADRTRRMPLV